MTRILVLGCSLISLCLIVSCGGSTETEQKGDKLPIKQINYYVRYMMAKLELEARASFRTDTATIEMPEKVTVNFEPMRLKKLPKIGKQYRYIVDRVPIEDEYVFRYTDGDGEEYKDTIGIRGFKKFRMDTAKIGRMQPANLVWDGNPLEPQDALILIFRDSKGKTLTLKHVGRTNGNKLPIQAGQLGALAPGEVTITANRRCQIMYPRDQTQINLEMEYYLKPITFELLES
jgi:hypothetical protein